MSGNTRYSGLDSSRADTSLPPISKMSVHSSSNPSTGATTPRKFSYSKGLSKSQNALTKINSNGFDEVTRQGDYVRYNRHFVRQLERFSSQQALYPADLKQSYAAEKHAAMNVRTVADIPTGHIKQTAWESSRTSPVISADGISTRVIKFLAADNTLHLTPTRRNVGRTNGPTNFAQTNSPSGALQSPVKLSPISSEKLNPAFSHFGPVLRNSSVAKTFQKQGKYTRTSNPNFSPQQKFSDKPVSIRRKIEQYRKKYDEQYTDKLKKLKLDGERDSNKHNSVKPNSIPYYVVDFTKILEARIRQNVTDDEKAASLEQHQQGLENRKGNIFMNSGPQNESLMTLSAFEPRPSSERTWKTWRDINNSYAYDDVAKYIRDNELMDTERENWIKSWLADVHVAMENMKESGDLDFMET